MLERNNSRQFEEMVMAPKTSELNNLFTGITNILRNKEEINIQL